MKTAKEIEVRIPTNPKDLRIKHFKSMSFFSASQTEFKTIQESMFFLSAFTGLPYNVLMDFRAADIKKMAAAALNAISKLDLISKLPEEIKLAGTTYYLVQPDKVGIGWHIDFKSCNIEKDPVRLACMFYLQKGYNYSDVDENGNIKFPIDSRYKVFEEHFPLDLFIRTAGFFLSRLISSTQKELLAETKGIRKRISLARVIMNPSSGKRLLKQL